MIRFARPLVICWLSLSKCCSIRVERLYLHMSFFCRGSCDRRCCTCSAEVGVLRTCDLSFHHNPYGTEATLHWDFGGIFSGNTNMRKQETTSLCCRYFSRNPDLCTIWPAEGNLKRASARPTHVYLTKAALIIYLITYLICIYHTYKHMHAYIWFTYVYNLETHRTGVIVTLWSLKHVHHCLSFSFNGTVFWLSQAERARSRAIEATRELISSARRKEAHRKRCLNNAGANAWEQFGAGSN